tara:strand:- start:5184 stop:6002 length:819 start_codon:yes stop_codon:yes gene_type:complete
MIVEYYGVADNFCEWHYINSIIDHLKFDDSVKLHVVSVTQEWDYRDKVVLNPDVKNIIFALADEYMTDNIPQDWEDNAFVFKAYLRADQEKGNVHSLPLGYNKKHIPLEILPVINRPFDVFFAGHMSSKNRHDYMSSVIEFFGDIKTKDRPQLDINITKGFNLGLDGEAYSKSMQRAKIAICPAGNVSNETFRHYEAMRSGTIVVSPTLPDTKIYNGSYICQVKNWHKDAGNVIMDLLKDLDMLQLIQDKQNDDFVDRFCPQAVAKYVTNLV